MKPRDDVLYRITKQPFELDFPPLKALNTRQRYMINGFSSCEMKAREEQEARRLLFLISSRDGLSLYTEQLFESCECFVCKHFLLSDSRAGRGERDRARWKIIKSNFLLCFILAREWFITSVKLRFRKQQDCSSNTPAFIRKLGPVSSWQPRKNRQKHIFLFFMTSNTTFAFISLPSSPGSAFLHIANMSESFIWYRRVDSWRYVVTA